MYLNDSFCNNMESFHLDFRQIHVKRDKKLKQS